MSRYNTNNPVPSNQVKDFSDNAQIVDEIVHLQQPTTTDRFGENIKTWFGIQQDANEAISQYGYITLDSFEDGNGLTVPNAVLRLEATGEYYRWDGTFPKVVPSGSTPQSTGGIGPGAWLSVGDATLRGEVFALNGGVTRGFQTVADMKSFSSISDGHTFSTAGYYTAGDGGGATYLASTTGATPDGYGDHVASNGIFLRLISNPTDLNHGVIIDSTYVPATAWHNRNAIQTMARNERWNYFQLKAQGTIYHLGCSNIGRDNTTIHIMSGCKIIGRYDDPSIPESTVSQSGGMLGFAHFFDPDNGDFIPYLLTDLRVNAQIYNSHFIIDGDVSTEYNSIHSNKYNNNAIAFFKGNQCSITGSGGCSGSDHRAFNFDVDSTNPNNFGGSVNVNIDIAYSQNVIDNHCMISGSSSSSNAYGSIKIGYAGSMLPGGINSPMVARVAGGLKFDIEIGSFEGNGVIKPTLVAAYDVTEVNVKCGRCSGASKLLYQSDTLYSDVEVSQIYNTVTGIERAGTKPGRMRMARLHDVKFTDTTFAIAYNALTNTEKFIRLRIDNNYFLNSSPSFVYYGNKQTSGLPTRLDIMENLSPSGISVVEFNKLSNQQTDNLITAGATTANINLKSPDWNYSKMTVIAQSSGAYGACEIDLRTRLITLQNVAYSAGAITVNTAITGSTLAITLSSGASLGIVTLHN